MYVVEGGGAQTQRWAVVVAPELRLGPDSTHQLSDHLQKFKKLITCISEYCQVALVHLCCSEREMKRCASDMSEDDSTGNVVPPDGGGKKAVSLRALLR